VKHFAVVTSDMELVLDIVGALEAGGHRVELAEEAEQAMVFVPKPDALIVDAGAGGSKVRADVRAWADREGVAIIMVGPENAASVAERIGAGFIERPATVVPTLAKFRKRGGMPTDPEPLWPMVLLDTLESVVSRPEHADSGAPDAPVSRPVIALSFATDEEHTLARRALGSVLVVEDDDANRGAIVDVLQENGFRVLAARDGVEALEVLRARSEPPRAILMDLMMPRMNGWELHKAIAENPKLAGVPLVVISVLAPATELKGSVAAQLHKPLDMHELLATVESVTEDHHRSGS
jgi:DNA-binding response OmpR family regulator